MTWRDRLGLVTTGDGTGTGFWLTGDRFLTCRHVIDGTKTFKIEPLHGLPLDLQTAEVLLWLGQGPYDAALIKAPHPSGKAWGLDLASPISAAQACEAAGFPLYSVACPRSTTVPGKGSNLVGTLSPLPGDPVMLQITFNESFSGSDDVRGLSGSPVCIGGAFSGMICEGLRTLKGKTLDVLSLNALVAAPGFLKNLELAEVLARCDVLCGKAAALMGEHLSITIALSRDVKRFLGRDDWQDDDASRLVHVLSAECDTDTFLAILFARHREWTASGDQVRVATLAELMAILLPVALWSEFSSERHLAVISPRRLRLPFVEKGYAELLQAALDGRSFEFIYTPEDPLRSRLAIDVPKPPAAGGSQGQNLEDLLAYLQDELLSEDCLGRPPFLTDDRRRTLNASPSATSRRQLRAEIVNGMLDFFSKKEGKVYFLLVDQIALGNYSGYSEELFENLQEFLPALRIVILAGDPNKFPKETLRLEMLRSMLADLSRHRS